MNKLQVLNQYLNYVTTNKDKHSWYSVGRCHCGLFLKSLNLETLPQRDSEDPFYYLVTLDNNIIDGWYKYVFEFYKTNHCEVTNLPFTTVVNQLLNYGFTLDELINLEHLQDKRFIDLDINSDAVKTTDNLISYLTNWINYEKQLVQTSSKEQTPVKVSVS